MIGNPKILIAENYGGDFYNFRVSLVKYLERAGFEVYAIIPHDEFYDRIKESGQNILTYPLKKNSFDPFSLIKNIRIFRNFNKQFSFDLVHSFRLQPNVITNLAFGFSRNIKIVNHVTGLGYAFSAHRPLSLIYRITILFLYQLVFLLSDRIIVQNSDDLKVFSHFFFIQRKLCLIESSGIDHHRISRASVDFDEVQKIKSKISYETKDFVITFTGRLLKEKGIIEFLELTNKSVFKNNNLKFVVAGWLDKNNPSCIRSDTLDKYLKSENLWFIGYTSTVRELLYISDIFILPTYREGFSRSILEAMAMEIPVITTNVPGAQDAVIEEFNGLLVKPKSVAQLEAAIIRLLDDTALRKRLGSNGRKLVGEKYSIDIVFQKIIDIYYSLLKNYRI